MICYHASKFDYDFPVYEELVANRENHANGNLGLWVATKNDWISGFGNIIYEVEFKDEDTIILPVSDLFKWERQIKAHNLNEQEHAEFYRKLREDLLKKYKIILFEENSGDIGMGIVLDLNSITKFNKYGQCLKHKAKNKMK